jgi:hypothetical protein
MVVGGELSTTGGDSILDSLSSSRTLSVPLVSNVGSNDAVCFNMPYLAFNATNRACAFLASSATSLASRERFSASSESIILLGIKDQYIFVEL